jgi:hypothetical protein
MMAEVDHRIALRVCGDARFELLQRFRIRKVIEFNGIALRFKVDDGVGADPRPEYKGIVAGAANRH